MKLTADAVKYDLIRLSPGTFMMGSEKENQNAYEIEMPRHEIRFANQLLFGKAEVTQKLWQNLTGLNPSKYRRCGLDCPVEKISWCDAVFFANKLSLHSNLTPSYTLPEDFSLTMEREKCNELAGKVLVNWNANGFRLPTEAEWEYAAKAGTELEFSGAAELKELETEKSKLLGPESPTHPVKTMKPNAWGIDGMSSNTWEWVWDRFGKYTSKPETDPQGAKSGDFRVFRGGGWSNAANYTRIVCSFCRRNGYRGSSDPGFKYGSLGFRLVRRETPPAKK